MDQPRAQERAPERTPSQRHGSTGEAALTRPALVEPAAPAWTAIAERLNVESNLRERRLRRSLALADVVALAIALGVTVWLLSPDHVRGWALLLFPAVIATAKILGLYEGDDQRIRKTTVEELPRLAQLGSLLVLGVWLADMPLIGGPAGKDQAIVLGVVFVICAVLGRRFARGLPTKQPASRALPVHRRRALLQPPAHDLRAPRPPSQLLDRIAVNEAMTDDSPALPGEPQALLEVIARAGAHRLIIGPHAFSNAMTFELLEAARDAGTRVSILPDMLEVVGSSVDFDDLFGVTLLGVRHTHLSRSSQRLKRVFDFVGASIVLLFAWPLMVISAIAVRLDSPGPILFRQWRIGRDGEPFRIFKFRTMFDGAEHLQDGLRELNEADGLFKITDDPRITKVGSRLRKCSCDELPQIFNVLMGQMSLVGPRPLVADEDGRILGVRRGRLRLTPGMTGQWQISGGARIPLEDMVKLDHLYVSNWTLWGDIKILLRTVPYVLSRCGR